MIAILQKGPGDSHAAFSVIGAAMTEANIMKPGGKKKRNMSIIDAP